MAEKIQCPDCLGTGQGVPCTDPDCVSGEVRCPNCYGSGYGYEDCWNCNGTGEFECSDCYGSGVIYVDEYEEDCGQCNGSGYLLCSVCGGTGSLPCSVCNGNYSYVCGECGGDGFLDCETCSGTGEIESSIGYSITFEENGGSTVTDLTEQTALPNPLPIPTKSGYTFNGWYYDSDFTTQAQASDTLSANVTLYAKWEQATSGPKVFEVGDVLPATTQLQITWQNITMEVETDVNYVASNSGATSVLLGHFYFGGVPAKEGEGYLTLYGNAVTSWEYGVVSAGSTIINTTAKSISDRTISYVNPSYATLFTWEDLAPAPTGYTITFEENGGSTVTDLTEQTNLPNPLPTPTKDNHTFLGWYYDSDFTTQALANDEITENVTLYAKWQPNTYLTNLTGTKWEFVNSPSVFNDFGSPVGTFNINFSSNGNDYTSLTASYDFNGDYSYIQYNSTTIYNNYTWTDSNYRVIEITGGTDVEDETLIAWLEANATQIIEPSGYTITFNSNGGTTFPDIEDATELPTPLPPTTKPGYTFGGWYYESNFQTRAKAGDTIEANTTLYAKWLTLAQVLEHINNVVEELRSAIINKGGDAEGKLLIDFAAIINSLKTYEVVETLAELELLEPTLNRIVYVVEGSGELAMGAPVKVTQDGDTLIIG